MRRILFFLLLCQPFVVQGEAMKLGVDVLKEDGFAILEGKKVGLVAHPASVDSRLVKTVDLLQASDRFKLQALFGPEHGVYGDEYAGVKVSDGTDPRTGLPIHSLYGKTRKPTPDMLQGLDVLVFDLQDIGSRSYTYISTMKLCLEACAEAGIELVILDRPNPLGGERMEGPRVEKGFESFISDLNVPYLHGMTMGEMAQWTKEEVAPHYQKLKIVKMNGWKRNMVWDDTGLKWTPTSPHIPQASSCPAYAATGILGELGQLSNGVGYTLPFELIGGPGIQGEKLAESLSKLGLKGVQFRPARYKPFYATFKDKPCEGAQLYLNPKEAETLVEINFRALAALDAPRLFRQASADSVSMFDKACGTDEPRKLLSDGRSLDGLFERWKTGCDKFRESRRKFLLYD